MRAIEKKILCEDVQPVLDYSGKKEDDQMTVRLLAEGQPFVGDPYPMEIQPVISLNKHPLIQYIRWSSPHTLCMRYDRYLHWQATKAIPRLFIIKTIHWYTHTGMYTNMSHPYLYKDGRWHTSDEFYSTYPRANWERTYVDKTREEKKAEYFLKPVEGYPIYKDYENWLTEAGNGGNIWCNEIMFCQILPYEESLKIKGKIDFDKLD